MNSNDPTRTNIDFFFLVNLSEQPKSLQSRCQFQMSHIEVIEVCSSAGFCSFTSIHTPRLWRKSLDLQVILDPCPAMRNLHKEMKSRRRTLQNLVFLKGQLSVNKSKLNHKGPLHSGQIFQLEVKSYLLLTGCDGRKWKWYVVTIVETAALLLQSCLHDAQVVVNRRKPALRHSGTSSYW